jgi:hypothetical protein
MRVAMIFFWLRAARQHQPGVRRARLCGHHRRGAGRLGHTAASPAPVDALQICTIAPAKAGREF